MHPVELAVSITVLIIAGVVGLTTRKWLPPIVVLMVGGIPLLATLPNLPIPLLIVTGVVALTARNVRAEMRRTDRPIGRFAGFRIGLAAVPLYFAAVGLGHVLLALVWSAHTAGLARDGQAFSGTFVLGLGFILLGLAAAPFFIPAERDVGGVVRGLLSAVAVAASVVASTSTRGYATGGVSGELHCIIEQGREICPPGDGTWIMDARPDVFVMLLAAIGAYALSHAVGRLGPSALGLRSSTPR